MESELLKFPNENFFNEHGSLEDPNSALSKS